METILVKEMMVPLADYATVSEKATLYEAVMALEEAQKHFDQNKYRHRAILVYDARRRIVGKLSQLDIIRSLEPKYEGIGDLKDLTRFGLDADYIRQMIKDHGLWKQPIDDICRNAAKLKVKDIMYSPTQGEYVAEDATLNEAVHRLMLGRHQSLLVTRGGEIVGILRLTDVFSKICAIIKTCEI
ncbi:MAG: CBS domain-containing protein [Deltaproteobacteria bacterium]|nr:CBS domain-containing protein [Deltaproteobacteria bacterium]